MFAARTGRGAPLALAAALLSFAALCVSPRTSPADALDDVPADDAALSGSDIYGRVVKNRFRSFVQDVRLVSGDRGGSEQRTEMRLTWNDWRSSEGGSVGGFFSKTLIRYTAPFDVRYTAYLVLHKDPPPNDQFVYMPSRRKIRRVNLRAENLFGTDFSFEDIVPREIESATYQRLADEAVEGAPCFVVEATPKPDHDSQYSRFVLSVEKRRFVPIRTRYWSDSGVEVKALSSPPSSIEDFGGVFIPRQATMRNLQQDTYTVATILRLEPDPELAPGTFDPRRLEGH